MFYLNVACLVEMVVLMCLALINIRKTITHLPRLRNKINLPRMIAHSLAYIIYLGSWVLSMFFTILLSDGSD